MKGSNRGRGGGDHHIVYRVHIKSSYLEESRGTRMRDLGYVNVDSTASMKYRLFV